MKLRVSLDPIRGTIPEDLYTDWNMYEEILFHIIANAIKFNRKNEKI